MNTDQAVVDAMSGMSRNGNLLCHHDYMTRTLWLLLLGAQRVLMHLSHLTDNIQPLVCSMKNSVRLVYF